MQEIDARVADLRLLVTRRHIHEQIALARVSKQVPSKMGTLEPRVNDHPLLLPVGHIGAYPRPRNHAAAIVVGRAEKPLREERSRASVRRACIGTYSRLDEPAAFAHPRAHAIPASWNSGAANRALARVAALSEDRLSRHHVWETAGHRLRRRL